VALAAGVAVEEEGSLPGWLQHVDPGVMHDALAAGAAPISLFSGS
jgi:hypothetical protein